MKSMVGSSSGIEKITNDVNKKTFAEMIANGLIKSVEINRNGRLWASQVGVCARKGALKAIEKKQDVEEASKYAYCEIGIAIEKIVLDGIDNDGYLVKRDVKLPAIRGLNLGGYIDAIAIQKGKIFCLEVKSVGNITPTSPISSFKSYYTHKNQALVYAAITGLDASLLYFSRNPAGWNGWLNIKQFDFTFAEDSSQIKQALFNTVYARMCLDNSVLPEPSLELTSKSRCGFCDYKYQCWNDEPIVSELVAPDTTTRHDLFTRALSSTEKLMEKAGERRVKFINRLRRKKTIDEQLRRYGM
jgi:hypothetical protein